MRPRPTPRSAAAAAVLATYLDSPLPAGDAVVLLDGVICVEVADLARQWDSTVRRDTATLLRGTASHVVIAIARPEARLLPEDRRLWHELHDELRDGAVELAPLQALPAA